MHKDGTRQKILCPCRSRLAAIIFSLVMVIFFGIDSSAQDAGQKKFKSPEEAFMDLVKAAKNNDTSELLAIFGPEGKDIISSGDAVADRRARERFVKSVADGVKYSKLDDKTVLPVIGKDNCPFPIPIVESGQAWVFSTEEGREEIINRRVGRNELNTIQVTLAYVDAQRQYASKPRDGEGTLQYAQHFVSNEGKRDGLYWKTGPGEEPSPLGPLFARATEEGYILKKKGERPDPYYGYYFKILKGQGSDAPGGAREYLVNGRLTSGFGLVAYPAQYGVSGIMTFIVNQQGIIYEKDLGPKTEELARAMVKYDPDKTWKQVESALAAPES
ncbi:MAG TPA: DUF2950 domain-containing protein [Thermodesulfovibrionales bacterium]|nr:DUF2950 domain-containing protein [Thermodesulfovibrionales bacterium]